MTPGFVRTGRVRASFTLDRETDVTDDQRLAVARAAAKTITLVTADAADWLVVAEVQALLSTLGLESLTARENSIAAARRMQKETDSAD